MSRLERSSGSAARCSSRRWPYCAGSYLVGWAAPASAGWRRPRRRRRRCSSRVFAAAPQPASRATASRRARARRAGARCCGRSTSGWRALLLAGRARLWRPVGGEVYHVTGVARRRSRRVQLAGVWLIAASVRAIDPLELAGIRRRPARERAAGRRPVPAGPPPALPGLDAGASSARRT